MVNTLRRMRQICDSWLSVLSLDVAGSVRWMAGGGVSRYSTDGRRAALGRAITSEGFEEKLDC